jgi:oligoendopeptidase F
MPARAAKARTSSKPKSPLGKLPQWDLTDLYPGMESAELKRDLDLADADCVSFEQDFKGRLADLAANAPLQLADAVKRYEAIEDRLGRLGY